MIERDGLKISISSHDIRDKQLENIITRAEPLQKSSPDHGTVHDNRVADTTQVDELIINESIEKVKSIFELVKDARTCSIFDLVRNPLVRDSLTWSGHKLQGRKKWNGLDISIENRKGSVRKGTDPDGFDDLLISEGRKSEIWILHGEEIERIKK